jgi:signal transduction histidine kinase
VSGQVQDIVTDVRRLVHDLRPPALDDRGLVGAIRQLAEAQPLPVEVDAADLGALSAAVEVAAYRIVAESLTNVVRHAGAGSAHVRLACTGTDLVVEIADDGAGIAETVQAGVGLLSVRERAAELGGRTDVICPPTGGTVVRAVLPFGTTGGDEK